MALGHELEGACEEASGGRAAGLYVDRDMTHVELGVALRLSLQVGVNLSSHAASAGRESSAGDHGSHGERLLWW